MSVFRVITTTEELIEATQDKTARYLIIRNDLSEVPSIRLLPFQSLSGEFDGKKIIFKHGCDGICLSKGNELKNLTIETQDTQRAIYQDREMESLSTHHLFRLNVKGQISFIIDDKTQKGKIEASFIHIKEASTVHYTDRPKRYGVELVQGSFTVWNKSENDTTIEVDITNFTCGGEAHPINGSGLILCGTEERMGTVKSTVISCGHIYTNGGIAKGIADVVSAGIAVGYQTIVKNLSIYGRITCYGGNEMGVYNWGLIEHWTQTDRIETHGPNGCGIINAGGIGKLTMTHDIETFGTGARAFYMFEGVAKDLHFNKLITHGDAACALQFNRYIDRISISQGIETFGKTIDIVFADSFLKASADAISIKKGGTVKLLKITGNIVTHGDNAHTIYNGGSIEKMLINGQVLATGENSEAIIVDEGYLGAENVNFISEKWAAFRVEKARINNCYNLQAHGKDFDLLIDIYSSVDKNIFAIDFLDGIFQKGVRIEYIDNLPKADAESHPAEKPMVTEKIKMEDITPKSSEDAPHPMTCEASSVKATNISDIEKEKTNTSSEKTCNEKAAGKPDA